MAKDVLEDQIGGQEYLVHTADYRRLSVFACFVAGLQSFWACPGHSPLGGRPARPGFMAEEEAKLLARPAPDAARACYTPAVTRAFYDTNAERLAEIYDGTDMTHLHHLATLLHPGERVLDVGCGTGRDVAWLRERGFDARGVDAATGMIAQGRARYGLGADHIWVDQLPAVGSAQGPYTAVTCIHVLHHLDEHDLLDALYRLRSLAAPAGFVVIKVPVAHPDSDGTTHRDGRPYRLRPPGQYRFFLERLGLRQTAAWDEHHPATGSTWQIQVYTAPAGGTLQPIETVESILWDDRKQNTYKFALVRALAELAVNRSALGEWTLDGRVRVPIGEVADLWIEYYWSLVEPGADGPLFLGQRARGKQDMVFRRWLTSLATRWQAHGGYPAFQAARERGRLADEDRALLRNLRSTLRDAIQQPIRYAGNQRTGKHLFAYERGAVLIDGAVWTELSLMGRWIEDSVLLRWAEFVSQLKDQAPEVTAKHVLPLLLRPRAAGRDTRVAREAYLTAMGTGSIACVWSATPIRSSKKLAVDHAIPWTLRYSNDLWNLLPADTHVNGQKSDRLPARRLVEAARPRIVESWEILWETEREMFRAHSARLIGQPLKDFGRREQDDLFSLFRNSIEFTAANRGVERWAAS